MLRSLLIIVGISVLLSTGARAQEAKPEAEKPPLSENAARFERLKSLSGTWKGVGKSGAESHETQFIYKVTAGGSAVMETLFVGTPHEMVTIYTLDGDDLVLTHYCAAGNQPRMKAEKGGDANTIKFAFDKLGGGDAEKDFHMHEGMLVFVDADHLRAEYQGYAGGKPAPDHRAIFDLERIK